MKLTFNFLRFSTLIAVLFFGIAATFAQTTAFTYQGRFTDASVPQPTNGTYNMQFALFDAVSNGNQIGVTVTIPAVQVVNGIFTVSLDYPAAASFDSSPRFLQVTVGNIVLNPRQEITSAPYAIRARNATLANDSNKLGGIEADQYVTGQVVRSVNNLTNNVTLAAGNNITITPSGNTLTIASTGSGTGNGSFIDNSTILQPNSNFNISGNGTAGRTFSANIVNSQTNFSIGGTTVFSTPNATSVVAGQFANHGLLGGNSTFFGYKAGQVSNAFSLANTFIGSEAGKTNSSGSSNSFVGTEAGGNNSSGSSNSFFGFRAGQSNTTANDNSFFGYQAGIFNTTGTRNSFFGMGAGSFNANVNDNTFFGYKAGTATLNGGRNTFLGSQAGIANQSGVQNTFVGSSSGINNIGGFSNSLFGFNADSTGNKNTSVGAETDANGDNNTVVGYDADAFGNSNTVIGYQAKTTGGLRTRSTAIGADAQVDKDNTIVLGTTIDTVEIPNELKAKNITVLGSVQSASMKADVGIFSSVKLMFPPTGSVPMCYNSTFFTIGLCVPNSNAKTAVNGAVPGDAVNRQQQTQINLQAEQIKRQQTTIGKQAEQIKLMQTQMEALKAIICSQNLTAEFCKEIKK
jgi:hypothetical protein